MFAYKPMKETALRVLLIAVILFNALTPTAALAISQGESQPTSPVANNPNELATSLTLGAPDTRANEQVPILSEQIAMQAQQNDEEKPVRFKVWAEPAIYSPGEPIALQWKVQNLKPEDLEKAEVVIHAPEGVTSADSNPTYTQDGLVSVSLQGKKDVSTWNVVDGTELPIYFGLDLLVNDDLIASETILIDQVRYSVEKSKGGNIKGLNGKVEVEVPAAAINESLDFDIREPAPNTQPGVSLTWNPVEIIAVGKDSKKNVDTFKAPIKIKIKYEEDKIFDWDEKALTLYYYDSDLLDWFPIETTVDTKNNTLTAYSDHLTVFDYKANNWQSQMVPTVDAFKTADFTGAGTYALNLWTPPAPGGLQPSVTLSYNSQVIDESSAFTQASWVGMGWDLDTGSITRNMHGTDQDFNDDTYSISAGGVGGLLLPISKVGDITTYNTADQSFMKVEGNDATYSFTAWTKDGTKYVFDKVDTAQINTNTGCAAQNNFTWRWSLSSVTDVHGNTLTYDYYVEVKNCGVSQIAVYPTTITYGNGKYSIAFIRESRTDYQTSWGTSSSRTLYGTQRLKEVRIKHNGQNVKRYVFSYAPDDSTNIYPNFTLSAGGKTLTLLGVQEFGSDGSSLPAVQFTYGDDMHLTTVDNGQGGSVTMTYEKWKYYDDVNTDIRSLITDFGAAGDECYDGGSIPTSWVLVGSTGLVRCDGTGYLQVGKTPPAATNAERSMPEHMIKPAATYNFRIDARAISGTTDVKWGIKSGSAKTMSPLTNIDTTGGDQVAELTMPVSYNPTNIKLRLECPSCFIRELEITQYPMLYRVTARTVTVQPTGNQSTYNYEYDNASPASVDNSAAAASGGTLYTQKLREFRGHAMSQVTDSASQLTTLSWFYQTDSFKGRLYDSLVLKRDGIYHDMEALDSANWTASSSGTHTASQIAQKDFDNSIKSVNSNANFNVTYTRATASVSDGEVAVAHVRLNGTNAVGRVGLLGGAFITMSSAGATVNGETLFDSTDFKKGEWYAVMFFVDAANGQRVRMWQLDNPNQSAEVVISGLGAGPFKFYDSVKNGTIYLDAYIEGVPYSESITRYTKQVQYDTTTGGTYPDIASSTLMTFKDLVIAWVHPTYKENRNYNGDAAFVGTKQSYTYADAADYGNLLSQNDLGNDGSGWSLYRKTSYEYYPKNGLVSGIYTYIVSLPARQTVQAADDTLLAETYFYYDGHGQYITPPTKGSLTMQRTWAGGTDYSQANFTYDPYGKPLTQSVYIEFGTLTTNPPGWTSWSKRTTTTAYDTDGYNTYPVSVTNELGQTIQTHYDYRFGVPDSVTDANNVTTSAAYDGFGRMKTITAPGDASPTLQVTYYDASIPFQIDLTQTVSASASIRLSRFYDGAGRQIQTQTVGAVVNGIQRNVVMDYLYDSAGRLVQQSPPRAIVFNDTPVFVTQSFTDSTITNYDILGRTLSVTQPNGNQVSYQYADLSTTVTDPKQVSTTSIMDVWGHTIRVIPPEGPELGYVYDVKGQLTKAIRGTTAQVDNCLNSSGVNCAVSKTTSINYDVLGRKDDMTDPDMGFWDYEYDALGNLTFQTDARGCELSLDYDDLNRLETKSSSGNCGTQVNTAYMYDIGTNGIGRRTGMSDNSGMTTWTYDVRGRVLNETKTINGATGSFTTAWTYNSADLPVTMTYPDNEILTYGYNSDGTLNTVTSSLGGSTYLGGMEYDKAGRIKNMEYGAGIIGKTFTYFDWSVPVQGGLLDTAVTKRLGDNFTLQSFAYAYDANANVETIMDNQAGPQTQTFAYDSLNRILSAGVTGGIEGLYSESYDYDDDTGNLSLKAAVGYTYSNDHPHAVESLSNGNSYGYDDNGNMTSRNVDGDTFTLAYDAENRLVSVLSDSDASQPTATPTIEPTVTSTPEVIFTPSATETLVITDTPSETPENTQAPTATSSPTETSTPEITDTPTNTPEVTDTPSETPDVTFTPSETLEPTTTSTPEFTPTATLEATATYTPEYTSTPTVTLAITDTPTPTLTPDTVTPETSTPTAPPPPTFSNATFVYDGDGKRVKSVMDMTTSTTTTYFVGTHYEVANGVVTKYYYAGSQRIAMRANGVLSFILGDHLGSTSLTTDSTGNIVSEMRYKAWGEVRYASGSMPTQYQYTGQYSYVEDFGLHFYNARWYDSSLSRFAQADTIVPSAGSSVAWDRYAYANSSPFKYTDPSGHIPCEYYGGNGCSSPDWWQEQTHITIEGYGYFDTGHIKRGWDSAFNFLQATEGVLKKGGGVFSAESYGSNYKVNYSVSANVTDDQMLGVLYGMYTDFERGYEEYQAGTGNFYSSFTPEDLPSDHLGFWAYMNGLDKNEIPSLLESLGEVKVRTDSPIGSLVIDKYVNPRGIVSFSIPKNHEFSPMVTDLIQYADGAYATQTKNIDWPTWLEIEPIPSGPDTWQSDR